MRGTWAARIGPVAVMARARAGLSPAECSEPGRGTRRQVAQPRHAGKSGMLRHGDECTRQRRQPETGLFDEVGVREDLGG